MKFFVSCLVLCTVVISQAQAQDSPEVAAAKAAHFEAVRRAELIIANAPTPVPAIRNEQKPIVMETAQHKLGLNVHDTPEVAAAKVAHYEAVRDAEYATAVANATGEVPASKPIVPVSVPYTPTVNYPDSGHYNPQMHNPAPVHYSAPVHQPAPVHYQAPEHYQSRPVVHTSQHKLGLNVHDTPEVAAAKAAHYEAVRHAAQAAAISGSNDDGSYMMVHRYQQPAAIIPMAPVIHGGVHLRDTPEVAAARASHFEALRRAEMTAGPRYTEQMGQYVPMAHQVMYMQVPYHQNINYNRMIVAVPQTNQHKLGINVHDTPEVAAAKAAHFEAFRRAQLVAAENERQYPSAGSASSNNYYNNPTRQYGQINY